MANSFIQVPPDAGGKSVDTAGITVGGVAVQRQRVEMAIGTDSTTAPSNATSTAYETSRVVKASAGTLFGLTIYNSKTSGQFVQLHNTTTLPADAAVPALPIFVPASTSMSLDWGPFGRAFSTGITICNSSTGPTKTIGAADLWIDAQFS